MEVHTIVRESKRTTRKESIVVGMSKCQVESDGKRLKEQKGKRNKSHREGKVEMTKLLKNGSFRR